jgi:hypothetical protein
MDEHPERSKPNLFSKVTRIESVIVTEKYTIPDDLESNEALAARTSGR